MTMEMKYQCYNYIDMPQFTRFSFGGVYIHKVLNKCHKSAHHYTGLALNIEYYFYTIFEGRVCQFIWPALRKL